jgi:hypothetical protein
MLEGNASGSPAVRGGEGSELGLWLAFFAGAWAWLVHLIGSFALVPTARLHDSKMVLHATTLLTLSVALAGAVVCFRRWRRRPADAHSVESAGRSTRSDFIAGGGLVMNLFFGLVILAEELPNWLLRLGD